ncbi:MAG: energy transducer TonB [Treponema sp.]|jgi:protein TonB|nr:energy transducer TonB [Treponema sp.]
MPNEKGLRLLLFIGVALLHGLLIFFLAFRIGAPPRENIESARVMKLTDFEEEIPPPPPPERSEEIPVVESLAETMIETDILPPQVVAAAGVIVPTRPAGPADEYLPMHMVSVPPKFNEREIRAALAYPPIALRSGIEGRVILELFVDRGGLIQNIRILQENPPGRGFGEAAVKAFQGLRGVPAQANGESVSVRYRYPVSFTIR